MNISLAMCTYNGEKFLAEQLSSIRQQTRLPDEMVVCDDGSCDSTFLLLQEFARHSPFPVQLVRNDKNLGPAQNFAKAIALCRGGIVVLCDQDDIWKPDKVAMLAQCFASDPQVGLVFTNATVVDAQGRNLGYDLFHSVRFGRQERQWITQGQCWRVFLRHNVVTGATMAFSRHFVADILPIPELWMHDGWIAFCIGVLAKIVLLDKAVINYRQHHGQQIGPGRTTCRMALSDHAEQYKIYERQFISLHERLWQYRDKIPPVVLNEIAGKIRHLRVRYTRDIPWHNRWRNIADELLNGGYTRYSNGVVSALKDVVM
jgi:glycosyltransferase involved in cell wall biosynthesis